MLSELAPHLYIKARCEVAEASVEDLKHLGEGASDKYEVEIDALKNEIEEIRKVSAARRCRLNTSG